MAHEKDSEFKSSRLRTRAEHTLDSKRSDPEDMSSCSPEEVQKLVHELRVHQIELETQNEDLRQAQVNLEELKDRYLDLYDFAPVGYVTLNDKGLILEANLAAVRLLGVDRRSLKKMFFSRFVCKEFTDEYYFYVQRVFETRSKQICEIKLTREDGAEFHAQLESIASENENGQLIRCRTMLSDISDRKRAAEVLETTLQRFYIILSSMYAGVLLVTDEGRVEFANQAFCNLFELDDLPAQLRGLQSSEMLQKIKDVCAQPIEAVTRIKAIVAQQRPVNSEEIAISRGRTYVQDFVPILVDGKPYGRLWHIQDISERKRTEGLGLQSARLRAIADLSSGVAHHFNNLLQIVIASASLSIADLESGDLSETERTLKTMLEAVIHGSETVRRLQTFANIRADIKEEDRVTFDIAATARNAAAIFAPFRNAGSEGIGPTINIQLDLEEGCLVQGKERDLFEVLVNLIKNASEAIPHNGDIGVKVFQESDEVVIKIRDTGVGIGEDDLTRIFEPFWSTRGVGIGKGMGLAVAHGMVKRHGGTISVKSKVGEGTTFSIRLPKAREPVAKIYGPSPGAVGIPLRILIIEDEEHIATLLQRILTKAGHNVIKTVSGEDGLAVFNKEPVDMVISDLGMPGISGWDVGKAIRSACQERRIPKTPFILLTGWGGQELEREKIAESAADAVIAKPVDSASLIAAVRQIALRLTGTARDQ